MELLTAMEKLNKDIKTASISLSDAECRYLVDLYYSMQEYRKRSANQCRRLETTPDGEPHETLRFFSDNFALLERNIKSVLDSYTKSKPIGQWLHSLTGIGPVIAAGLIANIDIKKVQTAGQIQAFCGLDPTKKWEKGKIRPWNASLKCLCWKLGESFVKVSNNEKDVYGKLYKIRKAYEQEKNENGDYAEQARHKLETVKIGKDTDAYKYYSEGKLPPAHINERSKRWAVKYFLSHYFEVAYILEHNKLPPRPYAIDILKHAHYVAPPNLGILNDYGVDREILKIYNIDGE